MKFEKLNHNHNVFKNNSLLTPTDVVYKTETDLGKTLLYWLHGDGLIPLHSRPDLEEEIEYRIKLKILIFGAKAMRERLKPIDRRS